MNLLGHTYKKFVPLITRALPPALSKTLEIEIKTRLGIPIRYHSPARTILEERILPYLTMSQRGSKILFVGCDWYTQHYKTYFKRCEYWTMDPDLTKKRFGAKHHLTIPLEHLSRHIPPLFFDVIICNGVLGYGLNTPAQAEQAFDQCYVSLRQNGKFIIGREIEQAFLPFSNDDLQSLKQFVPYYFPPLATANFTTKPHYNYMFSFFEKPSPDRTEEALSLKA